VFKLLAFGAFMILHRFDDSSLLLRRNVIDSVQSWSSVPSSVLNVIIFINPKAASEASIRESEANEDIIKHF
jgi:hypothetical protein